MWIKIWGLPPHLWLQDTFTKIGCLCGGLLEVDRNTGTLGIIYIVRIKVGGGELLPIQRVLTMMIQACELTIVPLSMQLITMVLFL